MTETLAFGVEPSDRRYRLRLARYPALAAAVAAVVVGAGDGEAEVSTPSADATSRSGTAASRRATTEPGPPAAALAPPAGPVPPPTRRLRLLDVGVGRGRSLRYVEALGIADRISWHGIDLDPRLPERIHRRAAWRLALADVSRGLPFRDGAFDVVLCEQVLEHLDDPGAAAAEIARVLIPGGTLVAGVPTFPPGVAWVRDVCAGIVSRDDARHGHGHVRTFTAPTFRRLLADAGFHVVSLRGFRAMSGGIVAPLEDLRWWWRLNGAVLGALPWFAAEVQAVARRR